MPSARTAFPDLDREEAHKLSSASPALPAHSSRGPGRRPLTAVTRVRIPYALPTHTQAFALRTFCSGEHARMCLSPRLRVSRPRGTRHEMPGRQYSWREGDAVAHL